MPPRRFAPALSVWGRGWKPLPRPTSAAADVESFVDEPLRRVGSGRGGSALRPPPSSPARPRARFEAGPGTGVEVGKGVRNEPPIGVRCSGVPIRSFRKSGAARKGPRGRSPAGGRWAVEAGAA